MEPSDDGEDVDLGRCASTSGGLAAKEHHDLNVWTVEIQKHVCSSDPENDGDPKDNDPDLDDSLWWGFGHMPKFLPRGGGSSLSRGPIAHADLRARGDPRAQNNLRYNTRSMVRPGARATRAAF